MLDGDSLPVVQRGDNGQHEAGSPELNGLNVMGVKGLRFDGGWGHNGSGSEVMELGGLEVVGRDGLRGEIGELDVVVSGCEW